MLVQVGGGGGFFSGYELLKQMHPYFKGVLVFYLLGTTSFQGNTAICLEACSIPPMHSMSELKNCELGNLLEGGGGC